MKTYKLSNLFGYAYTVALKNSIEYIEHKVNRTIADKSEYNIELITEILGLKFDENGNIL